MEHEILIKNLSFRNIEKGWKLIFLIGFAGYCMISIGLPQGQPLHGILLFLYIASGIISIVFLNFIFTVTHINHKGIFQKNLIKTTSLKWSEVRSVNVRLINGKFISYLKNDEVDEDFMLGTKDILISKLDDQLHQSGYQQWKNIVNVPYEPTLIKFIKEKGLLK